jgi:2-aminoadipate transaminase
MADPGYVGAIQAFRLAGADLVAIPADADGLRTDVLGEWLGTGRIAVPAVVYVVSNFSNPGGATLTLERRLDLASLADRYGFVIVDDDPYGDLRWRGERLPPLAGLGERVVTLGSFSKVLSPGLRVGYAAGPRALVDAMVLLKQAADLHTSTLAQHLVLRTVRDGPYWASHLDDLRRLYEERADALVHALRAHLGDRVEFGCPEGGLFVWARLAGVDASALLATAVANGVAFVPGAAFAVDAGAHADAIRLSFATVLPERLDEGVRRLAVALGR